MWLAFRAKWLRLDFALGPQAGEEEFTAISLQSGDLTPAPVEEEEYWEDDELEGNSGFGFAPTR